MKLKYTIIENIGLEYGAYDWYIKNIWDSKSDVFFMHDDIYIGKFNNFIFSNYKKMKKRKIAHGVFGRERGTGEKFFYMFSILIKIIKEKHNGIWYDKENLGYNKERLQPKYWKPRRYNDGGPMFKKMIKKVKKEYNIKVFYRVNDKRLITYNKGKIVLLRILAKKEKELKRNEINVRKKKRKRQEKKWNEKYGN